MSIFKLVASILTGMVIGTGIYFATTERLNRKCVDAYVVIQSFDVCNEKLPGCFFIYKDVLKVGRAIRYKQDHCKD